MTDQPRSVPPVSSRNPKTTLERPGSSAAVVARCTPNPGPERARHRGPQRGWGRQGDGAFRLADRNGAAKSRNPDIRIPGDRFGRFISVPYRGVNDTREGMLTLCQPAAPARDSPSSPKWPNDSRARGGPPVRRVQPPFHLASRPQARVPVPHSPAPCHHGWTCLGKSVAQSGHRSRRPPPILSAGSFPMRRRSALTPRNCS